MQTAFSVIYIIFSILAVLSIILLIPRIVYICLGFKKQKKFEEAKELHRFAIIIPARNESKVISQILDSIKNQNYDKNKIDTYVVVESIDDPTCEIVKNYERTHLFVRAHLELKGKGYALDECFKDILKRDEKYEGYFIFDADNVLDSDYISEMNKVFDQGYDVGVGYRAIKNVNDSVVAACSGYYFTMASSFKNKPKVFTGQNVQVCGTGFYLRAEIIDKLGGWPFHTLTEDYEFSQYIINHNLKSTYNEYAIFYDEQPKKFSDSAKQRVRWCKGFLQVGKVHKKEIKEARKEARGKKIFEVYENYITLLPLIVSIVTVAFYVIANIVMLVLSLIYNSTYLSASLAGIFCPLVLVYLLMVIYSYVIMLAESDKVKCKPNVLILSGLFNPIYMVAYVPIFLKAFFSKKVEWVPIEHTAVLDDGR